MLDILRLGKRGGAYSFVLSAFLLCAITFSIFFTLSFIPSSSPKANATALASSKPVCSYYTCSFIMSDGSIHAFPSNTYRVILPAPSSSGFSASPALKASPTAQNPQGAGYGRIIYKPDNNNPRAVKGECALYYCSFIMEDGSITGFVVSLDNYISPAASTSGWSTSTITTANETTGQGRTIYTPVNGVKAVDSGCGYHSCTFIMSDGSLQGFMVASTSESDLKRYYPAATSNPGWSSDPILVSSSVNNVGRTIYIPVGSQRPSQIQCALIGSCIVLMNDGTIDHFGTHHWPGVEDYAPATSSSGWSTNDALPSSPTNNVGRTIYTPVNGVTPVNSDCSYQSCSIVMSDGSISGFNISPGAANPGDTPPYSYPDESSSGWATTPALGGSAQNDRGHTVYTTVNGVEAKIANCGYENCTFIMSDGSLAGFSGHVFTSASMPAESSSPGWSTSPALEGALTNNYGRTFYIPKDGVKVKRGNCAYFSCSFIMSDGSIQGFNTYANSYYTYPSSSTSSWSTDPALEGSLSNNVGHTIYVPVNGIEPYYGSCNMYSSTYVMNDGTIHGFGISTSAGIYPAASDKFWSTDQALAQSAATNYAREIYALRKVQLKVSSVVTVRDKQYNSSVDASINSAGQNAELTLYPSNDPLPAGEDDVQIKYSSARAKFDDPNVGNDKQVTIKGLDIHGADADLYELVDRNGNSVFDDSATWHETANITKRMINVSIMTVNAIKNMPVTVPTRTFPAGGWTLMAGRDTVCKGVLCGSDRLVKGSIKINDNADPNSGPVCQGVTSPSVSPQVAISVVGKYDNCIVVDEPFEATNPNNYAFNVVPGKLQVNAQYIQCLDDEAALGFKICHNDGAVFDGDDHLSVRQIMSDDARFSAFDQEITTDNVLYRLWDIKLQNSNGTNQALPTGRINNIDITKANATISVKDAEFRDTESEHQLFHKHYNDQGIADAIAKIDSSRVANVNVDTSASTDGLEWITDRLSEFGYSYPKPVSISLPPNDINEIDNPNTPNNAQADTGLDFVLFFMLLMLSLLVGVCTRSLLIKGK